MCTECGPASFQAEKICHPSQRLSTAIKAAICSCYSKAHGRWATVLRLRGAHSLPKVSMLQHSGHAPLGCVRCVECTSALRRCRHAHSAQSSAAAIAAAITTTSRPYSAHTYHIYVGPIFLCGKCGRCTACDFRPYIWVQPQLQRSKVLSGTCARSQSHLMLNPAKV